MLACIGRFNHCCMRLSPYSANKGGRSKELIGKRIDIEENFAGLLLVKGRRAQAHTVTDGAPPVLEVDKNDDLGWFWVEWDD